jgi:hypothetical protein
LFGPTLPCGTTGNFVQEPAAPAPRTTTQSAMALLEPGRSPRSLLTCVLRRRTC